MPVTLLRAIMGVPRAPKATGAVLAIRESPEAASGLKPSWMRMAAVTATGVPNPAAPSKKAPKEKAMRMTWTRGSGANRERPLRRTSRYDANAVAGFDASSARARQ